VSLLLLAPKAFEDPSEVVPISALLIESRSFFTGPAQKESVSILKPKLKKPAACPYSWVLLPVHRPSHLPHDARVIAIQNHGLSATATM